LRLIFSDIFHTNREIPVNFGNLFSSSSWNHLGSYPGFWSRYIFYYRHQSSFISFPFADSQISHVDLTFQRDTSLANLRNWHETLKRDLANRHGAISLIICVCVAIINAISCRIGSSCGTNIQLSRHSMVKRIFFFFFLL